MAITYESFKNEVLGKGFDVDKYYGEQCLNKGSLVEKNDGSWELVEDLRKGDLLKGGNTVVSNNVKKSEIIHVETGTGNFYVSPDHRFIMQNGSECTANNLTIDSVIQLDTNEEANTFDIEFTDYELMLFGSLLTGLNNHISSLDDSGSKLNDLISKFNNGELTRNFTKEQFAHIIDGCMIGNWDKNQDSAILTSDNKKLLLSIQYGCLINGWYAKLSERMRKFGLPAYELEIDKKRVPSSKVIKIEKYNDDDIFVLNVDGDHTYFAENHKHHNCWDGFAYYCQQLGYPVIHCTGSKYAEDIWTHRATNGILQHFDETPVMLPGDVAIFKRSPSTPLSHVAIFDHDIDGVNGAFLGQNQGGKVVSPNGGSAFNIISLPYAATYDTAFRPKCFANKSDSKPSNSLFPLEGADISEHNAVDGWGKQGFLIPRCSYGENEDKKFSQFVSKYKSIIQGVYVFSYALDRQQAKQEAEYAVKLVKKYGLDNPVIFYDYEYDSVNWAKKNGKNPTKASVQLFTDTFAETVRAAGYRSGVYLNYDYWNSYYSGYSFKDNLVWFACYNQSLSIPNECVDVWQYSSDGYDHNRAKKDAFKTAQKPQVVKGEQGSVYRLYNQNNGDHLYTTDYNEAKTLAGLGWTYEGIEWLAPEQGLPVYRLYNPNDGRHIFTTDENEKSALVNEINCKFEGIAFYSDGNKPIYRMYNPNSGEHVLTAKRKEHNELSKIGWYCEGQDIKYER